MQLHQKIVQVRKQKGWSQEALAEHSGLSLRTIQRIERQQVQPRPFTLNTLAQTLQVDINDLLAEESSIRTISNQHDQFDFFSGIRLSMLLCFLPLVHIFLIRQLTEPAKDQNLRKLLSLQLLWSLGLLLSVLASPMISMLLFGQVAVGQFPYPAFIYFMFVGLNWAISIRIAYEAKQHKYQTLELFPALF